MKTLIRLFYILKAKKRYRKILIPTGFFAFELIVAIILNWQLFGEHFEFSNEPSPKQASIHNPLIVIEGFHSERITHPYGSQSNEDPLIHFFGPKSITKALCFLSSLMISFVGIFISMLWITRFFRHNNLNIVWWQWPFSCVGAHGILYLLANSNMVSHLY